MQPRTRAEQQRIDTLCGYAIACYLTTTSAWLFMLITPALAPFILIMALLAGVFGLLRSLLMPMRFWIVPAITLVFLALVPVYYKPSSQAQPLELIGLGMLYSAALIYPIYRILRDDFAKTVPDWVCEHCGYALIGLVDNKCPECGMPFDIDRVPLMGRRTNPGTKNDTP